MSKTRLIKTLIVTLLVLYVFYPLSLSKTKAEKSTDCHREFFIDGAEIFLSSFSGNTVYASAVYPDSYDYTYTVSEKVIDCCVSGGHTFALTKSQYTRKQAIVYTLIDGKANQTVLNNISISESNARIAVDKSKRIFIIDSDSKVEVFDSAGSIIGVTDDMYYGLTSCGTNVYAANQSGIFRLDKASAVRVNSEPDNYDIKAVSTDRLSDNSGKLYGTDGSEINLHNSNAACLNDSYVVCGGKTLTAYDKQSLEKISDVTVDIAPSVIFGFKNKLVLIYADNGGISCSTYKPNIFKKKSAPSDDSQPESDGKISFGNYEVIGKYIYVPTETKRLVFRSEITYEGYEIQFSGKRTNHIGTGLELSLSKNGKTTNYTFILSGDVNGTGEVNKTDLELMFDHLLKREKLKDINKKAADINRDGKISNADLVLTDRMIK